MESQQIRTTFSWGDFNIIKSNDRYNDRLPFLFNVVINSLDLKETELTGQKFSWAHSLPEPTFERIVVFTEWELKFPRAIAQALTREISTDYTSSLFWYSSMCNTTYV